MNDVFDAEPVDPNAAQGDTPAETQVDKPVDATPPVADTDANVPLKALEAERSKRREWRDKAQFLEGQLAALRQMPQQHQEPAQRDPLREALEVAQNERLDTSEMLAREKFGDKAVDEAFQKFQDMVGKDPSLYQRVMSQKHPWGAVVKETQRAALLDEIGDDPVAYRERLKAEIAGTPQDTTPKPTLPQSLAGARSTASRTAPSFNGPPPFEKLFPN